MDLEKAAEAAVSNVAKEVASEAWKNKSHLWKQLGRVWSFVRGRSQQPDDAAPPADARPILIVGPGGAGKTTLSRVLAGDVNVLIDPPRYYEPSFYVDKMPLLGDPGIELVVAPGQKARLEPEFATFSANIVKGAYRGVIVVVDYGYHAIEADSMSHHKLYVKGKKAAFLPALVSAQRQEELDLLDKLLTPFQSATDKLWVLVVVLKQDLWVSEQDDVTAHYEHAGAWGARVSELRKAMVGKPFYWHTAYACLNIQNYTTRGGRETIKKNIAGYDAVRQRESLANLMEAFDALRAWEEK